ncbi:seminase [Drosophila tropicalis]|uniref:seminase n=1 Tax=Drosophila tropicalis TaxID=46794 RepID=UPI0035ABE94B
MSSNTGNNYGGWLLYIKNNNDASIVCGASYYSPLLVITSANCIHPYTYDVNMSVEPTAKSKDSEDYFGLIDTVYFPPGFKYLDQYMDIALIRLSKPIKGKLLEFISLCNHPLPDDTTLMSVGWGFDSMDVQPMSLEPTNSSVVVQNVEKCLATYTNSISPATIFCATQPADKRNCRYDGGCPVVYKTKLCGIVSWGPLCRDTSFPSLYTNITTMRKWIEEIEAKVLSKEHVKKRH